MKTKLIETVVVKEIRKIVQGTHRTHNKSVGLYCKPFGTGENLVELRWGDSDSGDYQYAAAPDLRELAELFIALADVMEGK